MQKKISALLLILALGLSPFALAQGEEDAGTLGYVQEMDKNTIMTFEISADPEAWQAMLDSATDKEYIPADITINGVTVENVGIRPKGNSSLSSVARDDTTDRYSFKIKFDEYEKDQTWLGLDKIVLNSNYSDATSMKEYLSFDILSYIGVDTPLYAYADITVNGESWGFYLAVEDVEYSYLARVKDGEGVLYKPDTMDNMGGGMRMGGGEDGAFPDMGAFQGGNPPDNAVPTGQNTSSPEGDAASQNGTPPEAPANAASEDGVPENAATPGKEGMRQRGGGMGGGMWADNGVALMYSDDNEESYSSIFDNNKTKAKSEDRRRVIEALKNISEGNDLETYIDVDQMLRYIAGHTAVVNLDSYSSGIGHNYLLYENDGQLSMIPWDYNMAFGGYQSGSAGDVVNFPIDTPVSGIDLQNRPMFAKLLEVPEYLEQYHAYLQTIIDGYFAGGAFAAKVDAIDAMISSHIENDPSAFYTYEEYRAGVEALKTLGTLRGESIQGQLDGTIPSTTEAQAAEPDKLIDASSVNMSDLGSMNGMGGGFSGFGGGDMDAMRQAMQILQSAENGELTDAQRAQLTELGITDEMIEQMQRFR